MLQAWWAKERVRNAGKRIVFSLLAAWLHCAVLFFLVMDLFKGSENSVQNATNAIHQSAQVVNVHLLSSIAPKPEASIPQPAPQAAIPAQVENDLKTAKAVESTTLENGTKKHLQEHGILSCSSLTKKPERIIYGEDDIRYVPDGNPPGYMVLRETINRTGTVINVVVEESTMSKVMEDQTIAWAYRKFYHPGEIGGVAVDCEFRYMVSAAPP